MYTYSKDNFYFAVDFKNGYVKSLSYKKTELLSENMPIFRLCLMDKEGKQNVILASEATAVSENGNKATYSGFSDSIEVTVTVECENGVKWYINVKNNTEKLIEWIEYPNLSLKPLVKNGGIGSILYPYNEGAIVDDIEFRERHWRHHDAFYPSHGIFSVYPNMLFSQFLCYLFREISLTTPGWSVEQ